MKTKLLIIGIVAILANACTTGTHVAKTYDDDIYFSPADVPPVTMVQDEAPVREKSANINNSGAGNQRIVMSQMDKNTDGSATMNNYIYQPDQKNQEYQSYDMDDQELVESDTTVYYNDDDVKYVINNYYDDNDLDFAYRINRFHRPYSYRPFFYDDWYYGYYSPYSWGWGGGWGWDPWYYGGWGYPYSYYGYYSPFSFGYGGYWGYDGFGYGGYYNSYFNGYYSGYYNGYYGTGGGFYSNNQVAKRRSTNMNLPGGSGQPGGSFTAGGRSSNLKSGSNESPSGIQNGSRSSWTENGHVRSRSIDAGGNSQDTKSATIINNRRTNVNADGTRQSSRTPSSQIQERSDNRAQQVTRPGTSASGNARRTYEPSTTGSTYSQGRPVNQGQNYTPSYNKPRVVNQSNYNNNSYTRPRTIESNDGRAVIKSGSTGNSGSTYSQPRSSSTVRQTYRSSSSYSSGSSTSSPRSSSTYSSPSYNSGQSSPSYSAPARSSSSSSGGSYSGGSSSGSSSGGSSSGGRSSSGSSGGGSGSRR